MLVRLNASDLRGVFKDIRPLYKGMKDGALLGITIEQHILSITAQCGLVYTQSLSVEEGGPYAITVLYQDLLELLPSRGVAELELTPLFVEIQCEGVRVTLSQANGMLSKYPTRGSDFSPIPAGELSRWVRIYSETSPVAKSLQQEAPITFNPPIAIMKFPTVWVQTTNSFLTAVISLKDLKILAAFSPSTYAQCTDVIEFKRGTAVLAVPLTSPGECTSIEKLRTRHGSEYRAWIGNHVQDVQQLLRSAGVGECSCTFYLKGLSLHVSRPNVQISLYKGDTSSKIVTLPTFLEYAQMILKLCGSGDVGITYGGGSICIRATDTLLLLSTV